jgi:hypothetical protein
MTKNIEDLLYRGDSLERMGELSGRLREDSRKYKKAAVRINWELLLKKVSTNLILLCDGHGFLPGETDSLAVRALCRSWGFDAGFDLVAFFLVGLYFTYGSHLS